MGRANKNASEDAFLGRNPSTSLSCRPMMGFTKKRVKNALFCSTHPTDLRSFVLEPSQVGWRLARTCRHQHAFAAEEIILATDPNLVFVFAANRF